MTQTILTIEKLAYGGAGLGRHDGKIWFVPYTVPGEIVRAESCQEKRSYVNAVLTEIITPSINRTTPPCPLYGTCGGCNFQHLNYASQVKAKEEIFGDMLVRAAGVEKKRILPAVQAPVPFEYRTRVQFKVRAINGKICIGFYRTGSHFVVDLPEKCLIAAPAFNNVLPVIRDILERFPHNDRVPQVDAAVGEDNSTSLIFHCLDNVEELLGKLLKNYNDLPPGTSLFVQSGRKQSIRKICGNDRLCYTLPNTDVTRTPNIELSFSRGGFSQVNPHINRLLLTELYQWLNLKGSERILDLYCGNGNFSLPLASSCREIIGIEEYAPSIDDAIYNMKLNNIGNSRFQVNHASVAVEQFRKGHELFDIALLDPPRQGALDAIKKLVQLGPAQIFYISCDPATFVRDATFLKHAGYELITSRVFDMFPQTYHIESLSHFTKIP